MSIRVGFLGPLGTYSHQVTADYFSALSTSLHPQLKISCPSLPFSFPPLEINRLPQAVFEAVESGSVDYGIVPIENSSNGKVVETIGLLRETKLVTRDMIKLKIGHALMGVATTKTRNVRRIYSHEQGLGQCRSYISKHYPAAETIPVNSTAQAAKEAKDDKDSLAICSKMCAEVYGLELIDTDIQDGGPSNTTRFIVLALPTTLLPPVSTLPPPLL